MSAHIPSLGMIGPNICTPATSTLNFWGKGPPFRVTIGVTCFLSVLGALLIIFSYGCFQNLRTKARLILLHISLMDLGVGLTNLIGNFIYFDRFYYTTVGNCAHYHSPRRQVIQNLCVAQAFFAHYFTQASILWTISLAVYIYFVIVHNRSELAKQWLKASYILCYGFPLLICIWLIFTDRFGYSPKNSGWCSILTINLMNEPDIFGTALGYDLWVYLALVLVVTLYLAVQLFLRDKLRQTKKYLHNAEERFWEALYILDYRFLFIPLVFTLLRMWTAIIDILYVYAQIEGVPVWFGLLLLYLAGIGDSAQGFTNAILFVIFTKRVRKTIFSLEYWKSRYLKWRHQYEPLVDNEARSLPGNAGAEPENSSPFMDSNIYTPPADPTPPPSTLTTSYKSTGYTINNI